MNCRNFYFISQEGLLISGNSELFESLYLISENKRIVKNFAAVNTL